MTRARSYAVVFERARRGFGVYVPDLPGVISRGATRREAERNIGEAIELYLDTAAERGIPVPEPRAEAGYVSLQAGRVIRVRNAAAVSLGSRSSPAKAWASRLNGRKGGRPRKSADR